MEMMLKYIVQDEEPERRMDRDLVESLQTQLHEREVERIGALEHIKQIEQDNVILNGKAKELVQALADKDSEIQQLRKEMEEMRRSSLNMDFVQREKELEGEIDSYKQEIKLLQAAAEEKERARQEEVGRIQDELFVLQEKIKKSSATEALATQQKKQIEDLLENEEIVKKEMDKIMSVEEQVKTLEKRNKELELDKKRLVEEYYGDKNKVMGIETEMKRLAENCAHAEKEEKRAEERAKFWEQKAKETEETLKTLREEGESFKLVQGAGCLLSQEKEANYQAEITKLRGQVSTLSAGTEEKVRLRLVELEAKLDVMGAEKQRLNQELMLAGQRSTALEKENEELHERIHGYELAQKEAAGVANNLQRAMKDRDLLLDVSKRAQNALAEQDRLRLEVAHLHEESIRGQSLLAKAASEKAELDQRARELTDKTIQLEKSLAREEEKMALMQEERRKLEAGFKDQSRHIEVV